MGLDRNGLIALGVYKDGVDRKTQIDFFGNANDILYSVLEQIFPKVKDLKSKIYALTDTDFARFAQHITLEGEGEGMTVDEQSRTMYSDDENSAEWVPNYESLIQLGPVIFSGEDTTLGEN